MTLYDLLTQAIGRYIECDRCMLGTILAIAVFGGVVGLFLH